MSISNEQLNKLSLNGLETVFRFRRSLWTAPSAWSS